MAKLATLQAETYYINTTQESFNLKGVNSNGLYTYRNMGEKPLTSVQWKQQKKRYTFDDKSFPS